MGKKKKEHKSKSYAGEGGKEKRKKIRRQEEVGEGNILP